MFFLVTLERQKEGREGQKKVEKREISIDYFPYASDRDWTHNLRNVPWPWIKRATFWCLGPHSNQPNHWPGQETRS